MLYINGNILHIMLDIRVLLISLYIFFALLHYNRFVPLIRDIFSRKLLASIDSWRFFSWWGMFLEEGYLTFDIKIIAETENDIYTWSLRHDKDICGIKIARNISRLTLTFYYETYNQFFLNPYLYDTIKKYFDNKGEKLKKLEIKKIVFNKYSNIEIPEKNVTLFLIYEQLN